MLRHLDRWREKERWWCFENSTWSPFPPLRQCLRKTQHLMCTLHAVCKYSYQDRPFTYRTGEPPGKKRGKTEKLYIKSEREKNDWDWKRRKNLICQVDKERDKSVPPWVSHSPSVRSVMCTKIYVLWTWASPPKSWMMTVKKVIITASLIYVHTFLWWEWSQKSQVSLGIWFFVRACL